MSPNHDTESRINHKRRTVLRAVSLAGLVGLGSGTAVATSGGRSSANPSPATDSDESFPDVLALPDGFRPEGITTGRGDTFFVGSRALGDIYRGNLRTGEGEVLVDAADDRVAIGLSHDRRSNYVFAAGGGTGKTFVYDADTGKAVEAYELTEPGTFVNDVVVTREAAYFTDSFRPFLYRLPLGPAGRLPDQEAAEELSLGGDYEQVGGSMPTASTRRPTRRISSS